MRADEVNREKAFRISHARGHKFKSCTAHYPLPTSGSGSSGANQPGDLTPGTSTLSTQSDSRVR
jgi:hypothetical protein